MVSLASIGWLDQACEMARFVSLRLKVHLWAQIKLEVWQKLCLVELKAELEHGRYEFNIVWLELDFD